MGRLTTHILDTAQGRPGAGVRIELYAVGSDLRHVKTLVTNADGRTDEPLLEGDAFETGTWEIVFNVGAYFAAAHVPVADPPFLDRIAIRFTMAADQHYHVPLLVSPWSYSTYRGS
ncbi:MAG: hydroxyisourate hydrolase [Gammaproteobacteria bacterium]